MYYHPSYISMSVSITGLNAYKYLAHSRCDNSVQVRKIRERESL